MSGRYFRLQRKPLTGLGMVLLNQVDMLSPGTREACQFTLLHVSKHHKSLTAEPHLEADSKAGLHDFTNRLIGQMSSNWCQQKSPQDLEEKDPSHVGPGKSSNSTSSQSWLPQIYSEHSKKHSLPGNFTISTLHSKYLCLCENLE